MKMMKNIFQKFNDKLWIVSLTTLAILLALLLIPNAQAEDSSTVNANQHDGDDQSKSKVRIEEWKNLLNSSTSMNELDKLQLVNSFFNKIPYASDMTHWGKEEYWATPEELINSNGGDCEDFAIAKFLTLIQLGVSEEKLRLTFVKMLGGNIASLKDLLEGKLKAGSSVNFDPDSSHMVLVYYPSPESDPLILDNAVKSIESGSMRSDLKPIIAFNNDNVWEIKNWSQNELYLGNANLIDTWRKFKIRLQ